MLPWLCPFQSQEGTATRTQQSPDYLNVQFMIDCVCRKDGRSWMYDLSQSTKRCSIQIMKQLFAACFGSDAVSLQTKNAVHRVPQESSSIVCLSILSACLAYQYMLSLQTYHDHCCLLCWSSCCLICTCSIIRPSLHACIAHKPQWQAAACCCISQENGCVSVAAIYYSPSFANSDVTDFHAELSIILCLAADSGWDRHN